MTNLKSYATRTINCPECDRKFSGRDKRTIEKMIVLHCRIAHQTNINTDYNKQFATVIHSNPHAVCHKLLTDAEHKALVKIIAFENRILS